MQKVSLYLLVLLLASPEIRACTFVTLPDRLVEIRPDFRVVVDHFRTPLPDAEVTIWAKNHSAPVITNRTDEGGRVFVSHLPPGQYSISIQALRIPVDISYWLVFEVKAKPSKKASSEVGFQWGLRQRPIREVSGTLTDTKPYDARGQRRDATIPLGERSKLSIVGLRIAGASLKLQNIFSREEYATVSDENGDFKFRGIPDGSYVLRIEGGESWNRYHPAQFGILVDSTLSKSEELLFIINIAIPWICGGGEDGIEVLSLGN